MSGSSIGDNSILGQNVMIGPKVKIGSGCKVQNNVSIYEGVELKKMFFVVHRVFLQMLLIPELLIEKEYKNLVHEGASLGANATIFVE